MPNLTNDLQCSGKDQDKRFVARLDCRTVKDRSPASFQNNTWSAVSEIEFVWICRKLQIGCLGLIRFEPEDIVSGDRSMKPLEHQFASSFGLDQFFNTTQEPLRN